MPDFKSDDLHISCGQRYAGAWSEINTRLQSRQTVNVFFVTAMLAALALQGKLNDNSLLPVLVVVMSWVFSFWIRHNDTTIGLLSFYCKTLEEFDDPDNAKGIPAWHSKSQKIMEAALEERKLSDRAMIIIVIFTPISMLFIGDYPLWQDVLIPFGSLFCAFYIHCNAKKRDKILYNMRFESDSDGKFVFTVPSVKFLSIAKDVVHELCNNFF